MEVSVNMIWFYISAACLFLRTSVAIHCIECNSANNSACLDMQTYNRPDVLNSVQCPGINDFCRKIVQEIILPDNRKPEKRVVRSCGHIKHPRLACYKADNEDHFETVCQCFEENCNSVGYTKISGVVVAGATLVALLAKFI